MLVDAKYIRTPNVGSWDTVSTLQAAVKNAWGWPENDIILLAGATQLQACDNVVSSCVECRIEAYKQRPRRGVVGCADGKLRFFNLETGIQLFSVDAHLGPVNCVAARTIVIPSGVRRSIIKETSSTEGWREIGRFQI